jgi:hypothetical protein
MTIVRTLAIVAHVILLSACAPEPPTQSATPAPRSDQSLSTAAYLQLGMPSPDRVWSILDYRTAAQVLATLPLEQLPQWRDSRSSELYARIIDPSGFESCADRLHNLNSRMQSCVVLSEASSSIVNRYIEAAQVDRNYVNDAAPIMSMILRITALMATTADEFATTLSPSDPAYEVRRQGLAQMNSGAIQVVQGVIYSLLEERALYSEPAALTLADALAETFPVLATRMPPMTRGELEGRVRRIAVEDRSPEVRSALAVFLQPALTTP